MIDDGLHQHIRADMGEGYLDEREMHRDGDTDDMGEEQEAGERIEGEQEAGGGGEDDEDDIEMDEYEDDGLG